ncbi:MAG: DUF3618 domain-containing protein [Porphyrobacter sp.]|nr:DUF3618 domain-containing protein [Porphyrobacter sp.]
MTDRTDQRSPDEIERDIRATQAEMSRTVNRIEGELTPRNILDALLDKADENGVDSRYLIDTARRNPLALGMIAAGGLWLVSDADARPSALGIHRSTSGKGHDHDSHDWHPEHRSYVEHMSRCERQQGEDDAAYRRRRDDARASFFMIEQRHDEDEGGFRKRLDEATDRLRERRQHASERTRDLARRSRERTRETASDIKEFYFDNPLVSGLAAAFVGAVAGSALPSSRTEESYVGGIGEKAIDSAKHKARQAGEKAHERKDEMVDRADERISTSGKDGNRQGAAAREPIYSHDR